MKTRKLGWTDLELTTVGLGTWAIGGGNWAFAWGPQDDAESVAAIHRGLELGINWVDTAPAYGLGHGEDVVGRALKEIKSRPIVATKCGRSWSAEGQLVPCLKRDVIRKEIEASLRRLQVDVIDLYQVHWPQPDEDIEEAWEEIGKAVQAGKIRYAGVSNFNVEQLKRAQAIHPVASLQPPYSMLVRGVEASVLPYCAENRIGVVAYSPMQKGLLTGAFDAKRVATLPEDDHRRRDPLFQEPNLSRNLRIVDGLWALAAKQGQTVARLAVAWVLRRPEVTAAIVGTRRPKQIEEIVAAGDWALTNEDIAEVERLLGA